MKHGMHIMGGRAKLRRALIKKYSDRIYRWAMDAVEAAWLSLGGMSPLLTRSIFAAFTAEQILGAMYHQETPQDPERWFDVYQCASDIIDATSAGGL